MAKMLSAMAEARSNGDTMLAIAALIGPVDRKHSNCATTIANMVSPFERASAMALSIFAIHLLGDVPSPPLIGHLAVTGSLARAVLMVPVALAIGGVIWLFAARADGRVSQPVPA